VKSEPSVYPWERFVKEKRTTWDGVRSFEAAQQPARDEEGRRGALLPFERGQRSRGAGERQRRSHVREDDATKANGRSSSCRRSKTLTRPVTLAQIKAEKKLASLRSRQEKSTLRRARDPRRVELILALADTKL